MKKIPCYLCGSEQSEHLVTFENDAYLKRLSNLGDHSVSYVVCRQCGFTFQNPALEPHELDEMYGEKYRKDLPTESFIASNSVFTDGRARWIEDHLGADPKPGRRVLDVGCGAGMLLNSFKRRGWSVQGIEPTVAYAEFGSRRFEIPITAGFFDESVYPGEQFDLITLSQVLEHATDPGRMLRDCRRKLVADGRVFIGVPTILRPQRPIQGNTLAGPHLSMFTLPTLRFLLAREGFEIVASDCDFKGLMVVAKVSSRVSPQPLPKGQSRLTKERFEAWLHEDSLYHRNLGLLKARWPNVAKMVNRDLPMEMIQDVRREDGFVNVQVTYPDGTTRWLHRSDPRALSDQTAERYQLGEEGLVVLLGFGMGYLAQSLLRRMSKGHVVVIHERSEAFFRLAMEYVDLQEILRDPRVELAVGANPESLDKALASHSVKYMLTNRLIALRQSTVAKLDQEGYKRAQERIADKLKVYQVNKNTRMNLGHLMIKNTLDNLHQIMTMPGVVRLKDLFKGVPAIIVSAGPSLQKNMATLKQAQGRAVIIACDTVLRLLVPNGITPDFTVTADPQEVSYRKFKDIPVDPRSFLVCSPINYPEMLSTFAGGRFVIGSNLSIYRWLAKFWEEKGQIDTGAQSVAHMAFNLAVLLGAGPIMFVGQDFCYYENKKYAAHLSKGSPWERRMQKGKGKTTEAQDIFGDKVETETLFLSFKVLMEDLVRKSGVVCINATEGGLGVKGTTVMPLEDAMARYGLPEPVALRDRIEAVGAEASSVDYAKVLKEIAAARKQAEEVLKDSEKVLKYVRAARQAIRAKRSGEARYGDLSARLDRRTSRIREKEKFLNMLGEYAVALELYMSSQKVIDIDTVEDPAERFRQQVTRAGVYYRGLLRVLRPFVNGVKVLQQRVQELSDEQGTSRRTVPELLNRAVRMKRLSLYDQAETLAEQVLAERPDHVEARYHLAEIALIRHHPEQARTHLAGIDGGKKAGAKAETLLAACREKEARWETMVAEARTQYRDPSPIASGNFYFRMGDFEQAVAAYQRAVQTHPTWEAYYHLAHAYIERENRDQAVAMLEQALSLSPDNPVIYRDLGLLALDNGQDAIAEQFWLEALQFKPDDHRLYELLSDLYVKLGHLNKAAEALEVLARLQPDRQDVVLKLAEICKQILTGPERTVSAA
jgi:cytochrome c-type biogenesis protein CcmH/NrfG/SAM-dependent methyltransferase